ncbi:MAG: Nif11-like leader peptide family RiPP precursor [Anaerolineae bacterium]|nr:Nif11-like leader peptide family RiPP precursor [Anaerolineae bacterium]
MSKENFVKLLETAAKDEQLMQQLQSAGSFEDVKSLADQRGFDLSGLSEEEAGRTVGVMTGSVTEELSDEELEMVAGGFSFGVESPSKFYEGWPTGGFKKEGNNYTATDDLWK